MVYGTRVMNSSGNFDWNGALMDSAVMAGFMFFTTIGALGASGLMADPTAGIVAGTIAAGIAFFSVLASKRGLRTQNSSP